MKRPVVISENGSDAIAIRPMTYLCMSWDHRALDGAEAARFLAEIKQTLEGSRSDERKDGSRSGQRKPAAARNRRPTARLDHEELVVRRGRRTGLYVIVACTRPCSGRRSEARGSGAAGTPGDAVADALRLSEAMTLKAAAAGLDLGGGKAVLCSDGELTAERRRGLLLDLGDLVESLDGRYITAEDVGTGTEDMA